MELDDLVPIVLAAVLVCALVVMLVFVIIGPWWACTQRGGVWVNYACVQKLEFPR